MNTFLVVMACVIWGVGVLAFVPLMLAALDEYSFWLAAAVLTAGLLWTGGGITWGINGGLFDDVFPVDGCYRITTNSSVQLIGKTVAVVQDRSFEPIPCGGYR